MGVCGIDVNDEKYILTFGGCISIVCLAIVFLLFYYCKIPNLKRHPTTIAIHKCWFEVIFVSQYLWLSFVPDSFFWDATTDDVGSCVVNASIWPLAWLTQFSLLGGELWFGVLSVDIHLSLTNPFSSHQANAVYYTTFVYTIAIVMATILVGMVPIKYGLSTDPMIWVHDQKDKTNSTKIAMFYFYMFLIYLYCGFISWWSHNQISKGLEDTLKVRKYSVNKQTKYVFGYFVFWTLVFALEFLNYLKTDFNWNFMSNSDENSLRTVSAFLLASRGIWSLGIFLWANGTEIRTHFRAVMQKNQSISGAAAAAAVANAPPKEEQELVQLNVVLQKEIVRFTGLGIQKAAREINVILEAQNSVSRSSNLVFFQSKMPGESVSFVVMDPDVGKSRDNSTAPSEPRGSHFIGNKPSLVPTYKDPVNPLHIGDSSATDSAPAQAPRLSMTNTPFSQPQQGDVEAAVESSEDELERERRAYLPSTAEVNFTLENRQMERQFSNATDTGRTSTLSTRFMNTISSFNRKKRDNFLFTDYSPKRFAKIRQLSGITMRDYIESFKSTTMPSFSEGKSGAFVYFSSDYKYIVKTTTKNEFEKLLQILPAMETYLEEETAAWRKSLITRFFGAHRIVMYDIPLYFVVMQNVLPSVDEKYDLKGSWVNRHGSKKSGNAERARPKKNNASVHDGKKASVPLFLDNDLQNCFLLRPDVAVAITKQIARDIKFLERFNLMDYSLLIGVRRRNFEIMDNESPVKDLSEYNLQHMQGNPFSQDQDGALHAAVVEGQGTFYIGIIDILQEWNWQKWYERMFKVYILQKDGNGLSATEPAAYRKRFLQRAVLDVLDGVDGITLENVEDDISNSAGPRTIVNSPHHTGSLVSPSPRSSLNRINSETNYDYNEDVSALSSGSSGGRMDKSFSSISRLDSNSGNSSNFDMKFRGTDSRFSVTPMSVNRK